MKKYIKTGGTVRFASKVNYIGTEGSGSVSGYWTIWETRKRVNGWSQPYPVHVNYSDDDIMKYRGVLWNWWDDEDDHNNILQTVKPIICPNCGEMRLSPATHSATCWKCNLYGGYHG